LPPQPPLAYLLYRWSHSPKFEVEVLEILICWPVNLRLTAPHVFAAQQTRSTIQQLHFNCPESDFAESGACISCSSPNVSRWLRSNSGQIRWVRGSWKDRDSVVVRWELHLRNGKFWDVGSSSESSHVILRSSLECSMRDQVLSGQESHCLPQWPAIGVSRAAARIGL